MYISTEAAERIVREVSLAVDRPVNLMNDHGIIIASTDLSRIGTLHQGAYESIRDNMDCLIVRSDSDYPGSRIGINIPIRFEGQIAGVVGIKPLYPSDPNHRGNTSQRKRSPPTAFPGSCTGSSSKKNSVRTAPF